MTGFVAPGSKESSGGLVMTVESRSAQSSPLGETGWAGLSGAAVFSGRYLIGIVTTDPVQWARSLEGIRSSVLIDDPDLAVCTGAAVELTPVGGGMDADPRFASNQGTGEGLRVVGERVSTAVESWQDPDQLRAELRACLLSGTASKRVLSVTGHRGIGKSATVAKVLSEFEQVDPTRGPLEDLDAFVYLSPRTGVGSLTLAGVFESLTEVLPGPSAVQLRAKWDRAHAAAFRPCGDGHEGTALRGRPGQPRRRSEPGNRGAHGRRRGGVHRVRLPDPVPAADRLHVQLPLGLPSELDLVRCESSLSTKGLTARMPSPFCVPWTPPNRASTGSAMTSSSRRRGGWADCPRDWSSWGNELQSDPHAATDLLDSDDTLDGLMADLISKALAGLDQAGRWVVDLLALAEVPLPEREVPGLLADALEPDRRSYLAASTDPSPPGRIRRIFPSSTAPPTGSGLGQPGADQTRPSEAGGAG